MSEKEPPFQHVEEQPGVCPGLRIEQEVIKKQRHFKPLFQIGRLKILRRLTPKNVEVHCLICDGICKHRVKEFGVDSSISPNCTNPRLRGRTFRFSPKID